LPSNAITLESLLLRAWQRRGVLACVLWPLSLLFGALSAARRGGYHSGRLQSSRFPAPVIVVGNLFVGGTGKTPLVIWLVQALRNAGYVPGVISRGYGARHDSVIDVEPDALPAEVGDEPLLIAQRAGCPVMAGPDRVAAARALLQKHPSVNVIVSDDGLQHYRLQRDVEIVLFDERGAGNGWLLPAGPLREPVSRRRDFTVINAAQTPPGVAADVAADSHRMRLVGGFAEALVDRTRRIALGELSGRILAAAGIGNPERFFSMLRAAGLTIQTMALPDHHDFCDDPFRSVHADVILITEKDAVKCRQIEALKSDPRLWVVPVAAQIDGPLAQLILEKLHGHPTA
jgi:tetraacyldisaccharide 4'-kinase